MYIYIYTYISNQTTHKTRLHKEAANPSPLCFNRIYRNSGPSWNGHWAQQDGHPGVGWSSWWLSQPIREGGLPQSLETTLKNWRSPAPTNDTCPPPLELSFPCNKMPMVDPGKICERQIGSCSQIWMIPFKKMFEKVHNNPVSVCFFWGGNESHWLPWDWIHHLESHITSLDKKPTYSTFPPHTHNQKNPSFVETLEAKSWQNLDPKKHSKKLD